METTCLQDGCAYLAAYDNGAFDDFRDSKDLSDWLSHLPPEILAQVGQHQVQCKPACMNVTIFVCWGKGIAGDGGGSGAPVLVTLRVSMPIDAASWWLRLWMCTQSVDQPSSPDHSAAG